MRGMTRSEFLKLAALGGAGATLLGACGSDSGDAGLATPRASAGDGSPSPSPRASREPARSAVLAVARSENAADNTARAVAALGGMRAFVKRNDVVVIKPNICTASAPEYAATTNPHVVATLVRLARDAGAREVIVLDSPFTTDPATAYAASGIGDAATAAGGRMDMMRKSGFRSYQMPGNVLGTQGLYKAVVDADVVISVPIAKQHGSTGLSLAGKNLMGVALDRPRMHGLGLSRCIAELAAALRPDLAVVDATRILVRNGPTGGSLDDVVVKNTVIASADWVAADAYATRLFDLTPAAVPYIRAAADMGLGTADPQAIRIRRV